MALVKAALMSNRTDYRKSMTLVASGLATIFTGGFCSAQDPFYSEGLPAGVLGERPGLTLGRWNFRGGVDGTAMYNDNVRIRATGSEDAFMFSISPHIRTATEGPYGRSFGLLYRPNFIFFLDHDELNRINHTGSASLTWPMNRLSVGLSQGISIGSFGMGENLAVRSFRPGRARIQRGQLPAPGAGLVEDEAQEDFDARDVGDRASRRTYTTRLSATYDLGHRTSLSGNLGYSRSDRSGQLISSQSWYQELWGDYQVSARTRAGAGVRITQLDARRTGLQISERPSLRLSYTVTDRLGVSSFAGAEWRQFEGGSSGPEPVFGLQSVYQLRATTVLSLSANRAEYSSARLAGQNYVQTTVSAGISQALPYRLSASVNGGYLTADYRSVGRGVAAQRDDEGYFAGANLNWVPADDWRVGAFYQHFTNNSRGRTGPLPQTFSFDQNIVGIQVSWEF
jgi:hypothetical protein